MKNSVKLHSLCFVFLVIILHSCKKEELPTLSTSTISNITANSASGGGNITSDGGAEVTAKGLCWGVNPNPTTSDSYTNDGKGIGQFVSSISGLNGGSTYHIRAYATNPVGTAYGADMTFSTLGQAPSATTQSATNVTATSATLNAIVNANYLSTIVTFDYGTTASYGQTITVTQSPVTGNATTNVTANLSGLTEGITYHFRIKTVNSLGTTNGIDMSFTTLGQAPTAITQAACCLSSSEAKLNGTVNANYVSTTVTFEYGLTTAYGMSVAAIPSLVTGNSSTSVSVSIVGLNPGTIYHFRLKAINALGTIYGDDISFITLLTDIDGNGYKVVNIGTQVWMAENLKTTRFHDKTTLINAIDNISWAENIGVAGDTTGAYCWYNNDSLTNKTTYGALYNWLAVNTGKLCPVGWHVPTSLEWLTLIDYLGGTALGGGKLKEMGIEHWMSPNTGATNESGFNALPGGYRSGPGGAFNGINYSGWWWTSTGSTSAIQRYVTMFSDKVEIYRGYTVEATSGFSVRCLKD